MLPCTAQRTAASVVWDGKALHSMTWASCPCFLLIIIHFVFRPFPCFNTSTRPLSHWIPARHLATDIAVAGATKAKDNLGALGWALGAAEVEALDRAAAKVPKQLIQNSFQSA